MLGQHLPPVPTLHPGYPSRAFPDPSWLASVTSGPSHYPIYQRGPTPALAPWRQAGCPPLALRPMTASGAGRQLLLVQSGRRGLTPFGGPSVATETRPLPSRGPRWTPQTVGRFAPCWSTFPRIWLVLGACRDHFACTLHLDAQLGGYHSLHRSSDCRAAHCELSHQSPEELPHRYGAHWHFRPLFLQGY